MKKDASTAIARLSRRPRPAGKKSVAGHIFDFFFKTHPDVKKYKADQPPGFFRRHKTKFTVGGLGAAGVYTLPSLHPGWALSRAAQNHADLPEAPEDMSTELNPSLTGGQSALIGGAAGGLGSLLYGTLADKPDLRRDLIYTLLGGAAGGAYHLLSSQKAGANANTIEINARTATMDKEAFLGITAAGLLVAGKVVGAGTMLGMVGSMLYSNRQVSNQQKQTERHAEQNQRMHDAAVKEYKGLQQSQLALSQSQDKLRRGAGGALAGGAVGGLVSNIAGKAMDRESMRRDIMAMLGGAAIGGLAGVYSSA